MARGPKTKLKRINAPSHWMLTKMGGIYAPRPTTATHALKESYPLILILRNRLHYALNGREVKSILMGRQVQIDGKVRTDTTFPVGFMDVISIPKTKEHFRLLYDTKGRFAVHPITEKESKYKLLKISRIGLSPQGVPFCITHDGRTIRYPHPTIKSNDTIKYDFQAKVVSKIVKFEIGNLAYVTGGANRGRIGEVVKIEKHQASWTIVHVKDVSGNVFSTRQSNCFIIGPGHKSLITIPKGRGLKLSTIDDRKKKMKQAVDEKKKHKKTWKG